MPKRGPLIIGIVFAIIAIFLVNVYISNQQRRMQENLRRAVEQKYRSMTSVLVAKNDIPKGAIINPNLLDTKIVPNEYVEPSAVKTADRISGMKAVVAIRKGEQITLSKLITPKEAMTESLAMATPVGKRAITVRVDNISGLSGMIKPGDYVDVIALLPLPVKTPEGGKTTNVATIPLFQKVLVLAVGSELLEKKKKEQGGIWSLRLSKKQTKKTSKNPLITLALSPQEASLLSFVVEQGRIRLVLRSPADARVKPLPPAGWDTLFQYINSTLPTPPIKPKPQGPKKIEIYRGLNKDYIPISQ